MSRFYVGQRVRVVCPESSINGRETTVRALGVPGIHRGRKFVGIEVSERKKKHTHLFPFFIFENHDLEPILYDGNQLVSWSECAWKPDGVAA